MYSYNYVIIITMHVLSLLYIGTTAQLSQECSDEALLQLSTEIAGYDRYKHRLGLSDAEIEDIDQNPQTFYSAPGRFYVTLKKWKCKSVDFENPSYSTATYGRLVEIAMEMKDGTAIRSIHTACVKHTSKFPTITLPFDSISISNSLLSFEAVFSVVLFSTGVLEFDLKQIATQAFSTVSYTEKCAL